MIPPTEQESAGKRNRNALLALVGVVALVAIFARLTQPDEPPRPAPAAAPAQSQADKESAWIAEMQVRVRSDMRDPASTQFRGTFFSRKGGIPAVCGEVNGNNAFGGKAGFQRFVAAGDIRVLEEHMQLGEFQPVWDKFCR